MKENDHVWIDLEEDRKRIKGTTLVELFHDDPNRFNNYSFRLADIVFDFSKNLIDSAVLKNLLKLAQVSGIVEQKNALFSGQRVNFSENKPALHTALRALPNEIIMLEGENIVSKVQKSIERLYSFANSIRDRSRVGNTQKPFTDILHIGAGGSVIGPQMVLKALSSYQHSTIKIHCVSNADSSDLQASLRELNAETTLIVIASKTFTTHETMLNAQSAKDWLIQKLGVGSVARHLVAVSKDINLAKSFGVSEEQIFEMWDWVGGRFSLWSAIGLPISIGIGPENFKRLLDGARIADEHFLGTPPENNLPILMGLIEVWYRSVLKFSSHAIIPYDYRLEGLIAHIQQLEMESNGKSINSRGERTPRSTAGVVWGATGTNAQHSFFQLLHQGTEIIPCDFLVGAVSDEALSGHQETLLANCLAQTRALMIGRDLQETIEQLEPKGLSETAYAQKVAHSTFPGNRPSTTILYHQLNPSTLGILIALYEHKVFVEGVIWNINSFDQCGVELGKEIAQKLLPQLQTGIKDPDLDSSTFGLLNELEKMRKRKDPR